MKYYVTAVKYDRTFHSNIVCTNIPFYFLYKEISMIPWQYYEFHLRFNYYIFFLCLLWYQNASKWKDAEHIAPILNLQMKEKKSIRILCIEKRYLCSLVIYAISIFIQEMMSWRASFLTCCSNLIMQCKVCIINIL